MPALLIVHWLLAILLMMMATFALLEAKSASLIPKSLFLWPVCGAAFGLVMLASGLSGMAAQRSGFGYILLGILMIFCAIQAFLVNIRKISRWPSGSVWLGFLAVGAVMQFSEAGADHSSLITFLGRLCGFLWAAIGVTKVISEKTVSQEGGTPLWIQLLYVQAILIASYPI